MDFTKTIIPLALMASESIAHSAFGLMGYLLRAHSGLACVAGVKRGRGRGNLGAQGRKERNACKDAIGFSIFQAQILSVKIVIGQN